MFLYEHEMRVDQSQCFIDITRQVKADLVSSGVQEGIAVVYCPHTTAGIMVNENADPDVRTDMIYGLEKIYPSRDKNYRHFEGNSHAHLKAAALGASKTLIIHEGKLLLGIWQAVYFGEFDGPRHRKYFVKIMEG